MWDNILIVDVEVKVTSTIFIHGRNERGEVRNWRCMPTRHNEDRIEWSGHLPLLAALVFPSTRERHEELVEAVEGLNSEDAFEIYLHLLEKCKRTGEILLDTYEQLNEKHEVSPACETQIANLQSTLNKTLVGQVFRIDWDVDNYSPYRHLLAVRALLTSQVEDNFGGVPITTLLSQYQDIDLKSFIFLVHEANTALEKDIEGTEAYYASLTPKKYKNRYSPIVRVYEDEDEDEDEEDFDASESNEDFFLPSKSKKVWKKKLLRKLGKDLLADEDDDDGYDDELGNL